MSIRAVVITVSDACSRGEREDTSGAALVQLLIELGAEVVDTKILSDDLDPLTQALREFAGRDDVNLIITTGGTGLGPRTTLLRQRNVSSNAKRSALPKPFDLNRDKQHQWRCFHEVFAAFAPAR